MDLKVSGSSLTQGMKGFSYFWDLFSGVTQACLRPPSDGVGRGVGMQKKYIQRPLFHYEIITMLGINSFPPIMGGNEFIPSTLVAVLLGIEACMMENTF